MAQDDIDHIPSIVPTRDSEPSRPAGKGRQGRGGAGKAPRRSGSGDGSGIGSRLFLLVALVVAVAACGWAWQLQQRLDRADQQLERYAKRIGDLEDRLSDTDEGMSQNATVQAAKIKELDSEVRKLWDNVWKKSKERLAALEASSAGHDKKIAAAEKSLATAESQLQSAAADLSKLKSVASDLEKLMSSARTNQAEVERVADTLNRINLDLAKLNKRVDGNEESIRSIDAFRRQVMANLTDLQAAVRILQASP